MLGARREETLREVAEPLRAAFRTLDVTEPESVEAFCAPLERCDLLVNNAGAAFGLDCIEDARDEDWRAMYEVNVLGVLRMTRRLLPLLRRAEGQIINVGSTAGFETYPGGAGYTGSKHALRALTRTLRLELHGEPVRICEVAPGLVETEFSVVRFAGDRRRASNVYQGMTPLTGADVAEAVRWAATRPPHVNVDEIVLRPLDQAHSTLVHRRERE